MGLPAARKTVVELHPRIRPYPFTHPFVIRGGLHSVGHKIASHILFRGLFYREFGFLPEELHVPRNAKGLLIRYAHLARIARTCSEKWRVYQFGHSERSFKEAESRVLAAVRILSWFYPDIADRMPSFSEMPDSDEIEALEVSAAQETSDMMNELSASLRSR